MQSDSIKDISPLAEPSARLEKELAKALALARTLGVAARSKSREPMHRCTVDLVIALNDATDLVLEISAGLREARKGDGAALVTIR